MTSRSVAGKAELLMALAATTFEAKSTFDNCSKTQSFDRKDWPTGMSTTLSALRAPIIASKTAAPAACMYRRHQHCWDRTQCTGTYRTAGSGSGRLLADQLELTAQYPRDHRNN